MKPVHLDGLLILIAAGIPGFVAMFGSDDAAKFLQPGTLFFCRNGTAIMGMMIAGLIAFRSRQYASYKANGGAKVSDTEFPQPPSIKVLPPATVTVETPAKTQTIKVDSTLTSPLAKPEPPAKVGP